MGMKNKNTAWTLGAVFLFAFFRKCDIFIIYLVKGGTVAKKRNRRGRRMKQKELAEELKMILGRISGLYDQTDQQKAERG